MVELSKVTCLRPHIAYALQDRVRLLQFITNFKVGGTERQIAGLVGGVDRERFEVHVGCLRKEGPLLQEFENTGSKILECETTSLLNMTMLKAQYKFSRYLRSAQIQVVHAFGFYPNMFALPGARFAGIPVVIGSVRDLGDPLTSRMKLAMKAACSFAQCITTNVYAIKRALIAQGYPEDRIRIIPNGIAPGPYAPKTCSFRLRSELNIGPSAPLIGVVGRVIPLKGLEYFLDAAAILSRRFEDARFVIIGAPDPQYPDYLQRLTTQAEHLGIRSRVSFTGNRLDVPDILHELTVSVLPSLSEGFSNVLLESMAAAVPVVATNIGGNPEVVQHGVTGLLVPTRDPEALSEAVGKILTTPSLKLIFGDAARRRIDEDYSINKVVRKTEDLYTELLERVRRPRLVRKEMVS